MIIYITVFLILIVILLLFLNTESFQNKNEESKVKKELKKNIGEFKKRMLNNKNKLKKYMKKKYNIQEGFINPNTFHKHSDTGQIKFLEGSDDINDEWLKDPKNMYLLNDYKFIPDNIRQSIYKNTDDIEKNLIKGNNYLENLFKKYENMIMKNDNNKMFVEMRKKIKSSGYEDIEKEYIEELEKDKIQDKKMKEINNKIKLLEEQQNNINLNNTDSYQSIKSFQDGQILSIINHKDNDYKIKINDQCLEYKEDKLNLGSCTKNNNSNLFNMNQIKNTNEFNNFLKNPASNKEAIYYPFQLLTPKNDKQKCLNMDKLNASVSDCSNKDSYKWTALKTYNKCSKFN